MDLVYVVKCYTLYWIIMEVFYFVVLLPSVVDGSWKSFEWKTFVAMTIINTLSILVIHIISYIWLKLGL